MKRLGVFFLTGLLLMALSFLGGGVFAAPRAPSKEKTLKALRRISVPFIKNEGQVDQRVKFYAKTLGGTVFVTGKGELVYNLPRFSGKKVLSGVALRESLKGAKVREVLGLQKSETRINYFMGRDKRKWKTNIEAFREVSLGEVYRGIELRFRAYGDNVEKVFEVRPGADPRRIILKLEGAKGLKVDEETGELIVETDLGDVKFTKPVAYQEVDGRKIKVEARYRILARNAYGFEVEKYDRERPLIIDPLLASTYLGGSGSEWADSIAVAEGGVYVAGHTTSENFPTTEGAYQGNYGGPHSDVFVAKLDGNLSRLLAATYLGGDSDEGAKSIAIVEGEVYVVGETYSGDFPTTEGSLQRNSGGGADAFVAKLDGNLSRLLASTYLGGGSDDKAYSIVVAGGNVYIAGATWSRNFPTTEGAYQRNNAGDRDDAFIAKLDGNLSRLLASTYLGGGWEDWANSIAVAEEDVYVAGGTWSEDFPTTEGAFQRNSGGRWDAFIAKLDGNLSAGASNQPPVINRFNVNPLSGLAPLTVTFIWNVSDPDGDRLTCYLDVDNDGENDFTIDNCTSSTSQQHTYDTSGTYTAKLTVDDGSGGTATKTIQVNVVQNITKGDVNGDYRLDILDALVVARCALDLPGADCDPQSADVNCDHQINILDALLIARKALGLPVPPWCTS